MYLDRVTCFSPYSSGTTCLESSLESSCLTRYKYVVIIEITHVAVVIRALFEITPDQKMVHWVHSVVTVVPKARAQCRRCVAYLTPETVKSIRLNHRSGCWAI